MSTSPVRVTVVKMRMAFPAVLRRIVSNDKLPVDLFLTFVTIWRTRDAAKMTIVLD